MKCLYAMILGFLVVLAGFGEDLSVYETLLVPVDVAKFFSGQKDVDAFLATNTSAVGFYKAGVFYLYHAYGLVNTLGVSQKDAKKMVQKAIQLFEKVETLESKEPMVFSMLGGAYLFSCQWGTPLDKMRNGRKGVFYMDKAVMMSPTNPRIREQRLRSYINLPPQYFPNMLKSVPEDADFLLKDMAERSALYGQYGKELSSVCYYGKGLVAYYQKEKEKAKEFLKKVDGASSMYENAQKLLKEVEK